ncbi:antibiotic biosynthesis monooxygenase [Endozoicomonas montiporae]|uniref:Antibiotic biosynthesis monooxygenase n=2 Tax=Endozoicomonas montiporae TaxID=1027273 RepID=A0A081N7J5_9GAMM|nr:putative quinol monooxygenase [Endozoicomonas montiporae]AMO55740.1 antibiotic biosynthesis monooxygenase [Endozoicomonas montiporae CL-33]KEQ14418.1 antibiotic biosynthesis monooxygenase [Endozoicomonas montiporae]
MTKLTIVANVIACDSKVEEVKGELQKLVDITRTEDGCISYDLHQDNNNSAHFLVFENWKNHESLQSHLDSAHFKGFMEVTEGAVAQFSVNEMTHIS